MTTVEPTRRADDGRGPEGRIVVSSLRRAGGGGDVAGRTTVADGEPAHGGIASEIPPVTTPVRPRRSLWRRLAVHPVLTTTVIAALLHVIWVEVFANSGGDLAAQDAWAEFVGRHPDSAYNLAWYGGMHPV